MNNDIRLDGNAVIVEGGLGLGTTDPAPRFTWRTELHSGGRLLPGSGEHPMTIENASSKETPEGEGEAGSLVQPDVEGVACAAGTEEKKLRIVLQVEVPAGIDDDGKKRLTDVNKISVVSEYIRAGIRIIGGAAD